MMLKKVSSIIIALLVLGFVFTQTTHATTPINSAGYLLNDTAMIKVNISQGERAAFYFTDEFGETDPPFFISSKDNYKKICIRKPVLLIDAYHQIPFLIFPGEILSLQVDKEGLPILTAEDNTARNNELNMFVAYYKKLTPVLNTFLYAPPKNVKIPLKEADFQGIINAAKSDSAKRFDFLRNYQKTFQMSAAFQNYAYALFKYLYIIDVLRPTYYRGVNLDRLPPGYTKYVDSIKSELNCNNCLDNESYRRAILSIRHFLLRGKSQSTLASNYNAINSSFTGLEKRYLLYLELKNNLQNPTADFESKYTAYVRDRNDLYSQNLISRRAFMNRFRLEANNNKEITNTEGMKYTWEELLAKFKGYTVYLDLWASWCSPCRANMVFSEKLKDDFKNKKLVFLDISIDEDPVQWQKAMLQDHMDRQMNYLVLNPSKSTLKKRFNVSSIPRYLIINKEGVIVEDNAIYPDNKEIKTILTKYLNQ